MSKPASEIEMPLRSSLGPFGRARMDYLKEHKPTVYYGMMIDETLEDHLRDMDSRASEEYQRIIEEMNKREGYSPETVWSDPEGFEASCQATANQAREIVLATMVYA